MKNLILLFISAAIFFFSCASSTKIPKLNDDEIFFVDYFGDEQIQKIDPNVKKCTFNKKLFKRKKYKMLYKDDSYIVRQGVDISRHDGIVNWLELKNAGFDFVILRCAYRGYQTGILHVDEHFYNNLHGALLAGFDVGVYVFSQAINEEEALEEADLVLQLIKGYNITLPVVFDPENVGWEWARTDEISGEQFTKNTIAFCEKVKNAGYTPMIYSNLTWQTMRLDLSQLTQYKMWYADYNKIPETPYHFEYWQHYSPMKVPGVKKPCDVNIMIKKREN